VICGQNKRRSRTAEAIFKNDQRFAIRSVGLSPKSDRKIREKDIIWADLILVIETRYRNKLRDSYPQVEMPEIEILHIPDDYEFMDAELISLLEDGVNHVINDKFGLWIRNHKQLNNSS